MFPPGARSASPRAITLRAFSPWRRCFQFQNETLRFESPRGHALESVVQPEGFRRENIALHSSCSVLDLHQFREGREIAVVTTSELAGVTLQHALLQVGVSRNINIETRRESAHVDRVDEPEGWWSMGSRQFC